MRRHLEVWVGRHLVLLELTAVVEAEPVAILRLQMSEETLTRRLRAADWVITVKDWHLHARDCRLRVYEQIALPRADRCRWRLRRTARVRTAHVVPAARHLHVCQGRRKRTPRLTSRSEEGGLGELRADDPKKNTVGSTIRATRT